MNNSMSDIIEITQKSAPASNSTQIGVQYVGMTPEQAAKQTIDLFMDNFPKLQSLAKETAELRATELCNEILKKLEEKQVKDFTPFTQPDVQFVLYEAQKNYARFGEKEVMKILTELIANRIQNDDKGHFKRIVDNAVTVACELSSTQLDCLSTLFMLTKVRFSNIITIEDLNVSGMMKNRHLSKAVASQKFYEFRTKLKAKCDENGIELRVVDRWYPSSKICHCCGAIKKDLKLSDRIYRCDCGYVEDRDFNAALNLRDALTYEVA